MRLVLLRAFAFVALALTLVGSQPARMAAQQRLPQAPGFMVLPEIRTKLEAALAAPNALLVVDYHRVDFRFGPNVRIDAAIVTVGGPQNRVRGLRVQVTDDTRAGRPERSSYVDFEEIAGLSEALTAMTDLVRSWAGSQDRRMTELSFTSVGGFRVEVREMGRVQRAFMYTGLIEPVVTGFDVNDLTALKQAVDQAVGILNSK